MNESCRRISRGQVWFLVDNDVPMVHTAGSIQGKNRPWLVVSNNKCNQTSPIYTVVPLTTAAKNDMPTHVTFTTGDKTNTILCEQIRTVSQQAFFNAGSAYKWTMSEKYMALVDEALATQLGLSLIFPKSEQFWESLERLIRVKVKQAISDSRIEAIDICKIATLLDGKVEEVIKNETDSEPEPVVVETAKEEETVSKPTSEPEKSTKTKRRAWNNESKKEFLEYFEKFGAKTAANFYGMQLGSVYAMKMKFSKEVKDDATN